MRITQIMLGKGFGGAERSFVDTARALAERGHRVQAICHEQFSRRDLLEGVPGLEVSPVRTGSEYDLLAPRKIARLLRGFGSEVVHTHLKRAAWHGGRAAHMAGVPVVAKLHNYVQLNRYHYVNRLIATTPDQKRHALSLGWPAERLSVIPNFSRVPPAESARRPGTTPLRLLSYGRFVEKKGFEVLLKAVKQLVEKGLDVRLRLGGGGPLAKKLSAQAQQLGIADRVEIGVWIEDVAAALDESDLFVLPSLDEPFGIVIIEAMARGVPIVTTRTKGPEQVLSDDSAWFVEIGSVDSLAEGIRRAAEEAETSREKAEKALALYREKYHESTVIPQLEALYRELASKE